MFLFEIVAGNNDNNNNRFIDTKYVNIQLQMKEITYKFRTTKMYINRKAGFRNKLIVE